MKKKSKRKQKKIVTSSTTEVVAQCGQKSSASYSATWLIPPTAIMNDTQELLFRVLWLHCAFIVIKAHTEMVCYWSKTELRVKNLVQMNYFLWTKHYLDKSYSAECLWLLKYFIKYCNLNIFWPFFSTIQSKQKHST